LGFEFCQRGGAQIGAGTKPFQRFTLPHDLISFYSALTNTREVVSLLNAVNMPKPPFILE
jgi:hypothetical protein